MSLKQDEKMKRSWLFVTNNTLKAEGLVLYTLNYGTFSH